MEINRTWETCGGSYGWNSPEWIVVHYTAGAWGVTAQANAQYYFNNGAAIQCGTHYFLGDDGIFASTPEGRGAWTNGNYEANTHSISIEVACGSDEPCFTETEIELLRELVCDLMGRYGIDADHVIRHYDVADHFGGTTYDPHKQCPRPYIDQGAWDELHDYITGGEGMSFHETWFGDTLNDSKTNAGSTTPGNMVWGTFCDVENIKADVQALRKEVANLKISGATIDYDKLANAVADKLAARMKE